MPLGAPHVEGGAVGAPRASLADAEVSPPHWAFVGVGGVGLHCFLQCWQEESDDCLMVFWVPVFLGYPLARKSWLL